MKSNWESRLNRAAAVLCRAAGGAVSGGSNPASGGSTRLSGGWYLLSGGPNPASGGWYLLSGGWSVRYDKDSFFHQKKTDYIPLEEIAGSDLYDINLLAL